MKGNCGRVRRVDVGDVIIVYETVISQSTSAVLPDILPTAPIPSGRTIFSQGHRPWVVGMGRAYTHQLASYGEGILAVSR